jgi:hypothetical protein
MHKLGQESCTTPTNQSINPFKDLAAPNKGFDATSRLHVGNHSFVGGSNA